MRRWFASDLVSVGVYGGWVLAWSGLTAPVWYQVGKGIAEVTEGKVTNGVVMGLAAWTGEAGFGSFFRLALVLGLVLGWWPLWSGAKLGWRAGEREGQALEFSRGQIGRMALGLMWALAGVAVMLTVEAWRGGGGWARAASWGGWPLGNLLGWALAGAVFSEVLLRGIFLGLCLKEMRWWLAVLVTAGVGWLVWAVWDGGVAERVVDGESMRAGWQWLDVALDTRRQGAEWWLKSSLVVGMGTIAGWARWRSSGLGWPTGLMAGALAGWGLWTAGGGDAVAALAGLAVVALGVFLGIGRHERD